MHGGGRNRSAKVACLLASFVMVGCTTTTMEPERPSLRVVKKQRQSERPAREARVEVKIPEMPRSASCRQVRNAYIESWALEDGAQRADLTEGQFGMVLGRGGYLARCRVPERYEVSICAAVQNGHVLGATVSTSPRSRHIERCIDKRVRNLDFPAHPRLDVTRTVFYASR
jgi:hypothetical protein